MKAIFVMSLMLWLVPAKRQSVNGESEKDARARYAMIAKAIERESNGDETLALFLIAIARHESAFTRQVHSGKVKGDDGRSWGLFQFMIGRGKYMLIPHHDKQYRAHHIVGVNDKATARAVEVAADYLRPLIEQCDGYAQCVFMNYGGVTPPLRGKARPLILARVHTYNRMVRQRASVRAPN